MQRTYYERLLADQQSQLGRILDDDITRLKAAGPLIPATQDASLDDYRRRYIEGAITRFKQGLAATMGAVRFDQFQQTPSFHEALVREATEQYWIYEAFFYFRAYGERTVHIGPEAASEMLASPLEIFGRDFKLEAPAAMLVFDSPEMVDAFYSGERRSAAGRNHPEAALCVHALEVRRATHSSARHVRVLSAHGDSEKAYRVEVRELSLAETLTLEDVLEAEEGNLWRGGNEIEQMIGPPAGKFARASRRADCGFYAGKTPYYRAVLGALHCARTMPQRSIWHPDIAPVNGTVSRLGYSELLPEPH